MATLHSIPYDDSVESVLQRFSEFLFAHCRASETTVALFSGCIRRAIPEIGIDPSHSEIEGYIAGLRRSRKAYGTLCNAVSAFNRFTQFQGRPLRLKRPSKPRLALLSNRSAVELVLRRFSEFLFARCGSAETTVALSVGYIRRAIPEIGIDPSHADIEGYITRLRLAHQSYGNLANAISAFNRFTLFQGRPLRLRRPRKPRHILVNVLSEAEVVLLIHATKKIRERAMMALLATSGIRNGELCGLMVRDVDIAGQMITVERAKGEARRRVCITGGCVEVLVEYLGERGGEPTDRLFVTLRKGNPYTEQDLRKFVRVLQKRAGIKKRVHPHLLRHSLATALIHRGASPITVQDQLGHADISSTMLYVHAAKERLQADYRQFAPSYL